MINPFGKKIIPIGMDPFLDELLQFILPNKLILNIYAPNDIYVCMHVRNRMPVSLRGGGGELGN
jgi:hypothetical protein